MSDEETQARHSSPFDAIRRVDEQENEYWSARELSKLLGYTRFDKFSNVLSKAEEACKNSGQAISDHMSHVRHMLPIGSGAQRKVDDIHLSRYACYLIVRAPVTGHQTQRGHRPLPLWERGMLSASPLN